MPELTINPVDEDAVLKEVWNVNGVEAKTELTPAQVESVNKLQSLGMIFDNDFIQTHLMKFMILQKSKDRKSMSEFVDVVKARREDFVNKGKGFFSSMLG